jgi:hypothetical protein
MNKKNMKTLRRLTGNRGFSLVRLTTAVVLISGAAAMAFVTALPGGSPQPARTQPLTPKFSTAVAFDVSPALRDLAPSPKRFAPSSTVLEVRPERPERGPVAQSKGYSGDGALQLFSPGPVIPAPLLTFEGLSNQDNFDVLGFPTLPPDPNGEAGPNHYVEMVNDVFGVYDKAGNLVLGPVDTGTLWAGFAVPDCTDQPPFSAHDPIVLYDQTTNRWILSRVTFRGFDDPTLPFYSCVAVSQTDDPTGAYYRYAFISQEDPDGAFRFPDYPKYGVWTNSYILTTRELTPNRFGIGVSALEKNKMVNGEPDVRIVQFYLEDGVVPCNLIGSGLLPPDIDGTRRPRDDAPAPIVGTQDDDYPFCGATFDALNIWELSVKWKANPEASIVLKTQLPVASFDSVLPCAPDERDCLPQPGVNPEQFLDARARQLAYFRLAYRNFGRYESLVANQYVEARPGIAGVRWYEIRRTDGTYSVYQQGTYAPNDGVHRWMGSVAMDKNGGIALGYSVVNGVDVFPGIRYTGRLAGDPLGQMTLGEGTIIDGTGVQLIPFSRWGDYSDMTVDPTDDCTFWYVNEYYTLAGQLFSPAGWQTRIGSFRLPGCQ